MRSYEEIYESLLYYKNRADDIDFVLPYAYGVEDYEFNEVLEVLKNTAEHQEKHENAKDYVSSIELIEFVNNLTSEAFEIKKQHKDNNDIQQFMQGQIEAYTFIIDKIKQMRYGDDYKYKPTKFDESYQRLKIRQFQRLPFEAQEAWEDLRIIVNEIEVVISTNENQARKIERLESRNEKLDKAIEKLINEQ